MSARTGPQARRRNLRVGNALPEYSFDAIPMGSPQGPHVIVCHSARERCGVREYGRQLDAALARHMLVRSFSFAEPKELVGAVGPGSPVLVHYEPSLVPSDFHATLKAIKSRGAKIVFCCHLYPGEALGGLHDLVDAVIVHRDYEGMPATVKKIQLGCPVYEPRTSRADMRKLLGIPDKAVVMTTIGLLAVWKRIPETVDALRQALHEDKSLFLQVHAPSPITHHTVVQEEARLRDVLSRCPRDRVRFTNSFLTEQDLLDRAHASDVGFVFHGENTLSVSAATKQFVSARTPLVTTGSTHSADLGSGVLRAPTFDPAEFAKHVLRVARDEGLRGQMRVAMTEEYERLNMHTTARKYVELLRSLGCSIKA